MKCVNRWNIRLMTTVMYSGCGGISRRNPGDVPEKGFQRKDVSPNYTAEKLLTAGALMNLQEGRMKK
jgi:hypothetical protein